MHHGIIDHDHEHDRARDMYIPCTCVMSIHVYIFVRRICIQYILIQFFFLIPVELKIVRIHYIYMLTSIDRAPRAAK